MKPELKILYQIKKGRRGGIKREKYEEYWVSFKFDTPEQREQFKEDVKRWYNSDCCQEQAQSSIPPTGDVDEAEHYRTELKKAGVKFHPNTGIDKLKEKYEALEEAAPVRNPHKVAGRSPIPTCKGL